VEYFTLILRTLGYAFSLVIVLAVMNHFEMIQIPHGLLKEAVNVVVMSGTALKQVIF
jgi:hypothetical protein